MSNINPTIEIDTELEIKWTVPWQQLSDADIVSEDEQNELIYWRDIFRAGQFRIGDIAAAKIAEFDRRGIVIPNERVDKAIGRFCDRSARTIRYYRETAMFFPKEIRDAYDVLPFSHFVFAKSMGEKWKDVLDFSMANPGISRSSLEKVFLFGGTAPGGIAPGGIALSTAPEREESETPISETPMGWQNLPKKICEISHWYSDEETAGSAFRQETSGSPFQQETVGVSPIRQSYVALSIVKSFASAIDEFCQVVISSNVPNRTKDEIVDAARVIVNRLPDILKCLATCRNSDLKQVAED